ncbi:MAG: hypothetical protein WC342_04900 [Methanoregula sp.]|jgi:hypothetical protein
MEIIPPESPNDDDSIRFRDCFSVRYIQSAALLCRLGYRIEQESAGTGRLPEDRYLCHEAYILNSLFSSVAFLESTINELWSDAADNAYFYPDKDTELLLRAIGEKWKNEHFFDRTPMLAKYQKILEIGGKGPFCETDPVFVEVRDLIAVRNYLMHYRREWVTIPGESGNPPPGTEAGDLRVGKFEMLYSGKFPENPLAPKKVPYFPDRFLGHGCAEWAVTSALAFTDRFFKVLALSPQYEGILGELKTR